MKPPIALLILDAIGVLLLGLGLAEWFAGTNLVPEPLQVENYAVAMVIVGILLMLPLVLHILKAAISSGPQKKQPDGPFYK